MSKYIFILCILISIKSYSQLQKVSEKEIIATDFKIDKLGNFYFINSGKIMKYNKNFVKIAEYNNNFLGDISYADVSDPFRTLLFFKDFNQIIFLDANLAELKSPILLDELGLFDISAICSSISGGFWALKNHNYQVIQYSGNLNIMQKGTELLMTGINGEPIKMIETTKYVFILLSTGDIFVLDNFGAYYKRLKYSNITDFTVRDDKIYVLAGKNIVVTNINTLKETIIQVPIQDKILSIDISGTQVFFLTEKSLITFNIHI